MNYLHLISFSSGGADYKVKSEVVAFDGNGATIQKVVVTILDDLLSETTEYFTITIEPLVGDVAYPINEAVIGIEDNDGTSISIDTLK